MSDIKDISLAPSGRDKIDWVASYMPVLSGIRKRFAEEKPFKGLKISTSIHLEAKTAYLAETLREGGAELYVTGCNPLSTQDDVAAAVAAASFFSRRYAAQRSAESSPDSMAALTAQPGSVSWRQSEKRQCPK